jgi:hypothetical protein
MVFNRSNGIYRSVFVTIAGLAIVAAFMFFLVKDLSTVDSSYSHTAADAAIKYERDAKAYIKERCFTTPGLAEKDCASKAEETAREGQRKEQDLAAQNITAWWTKVMGIAALIGMALSAIGVWLVKTTFDETRKATKSAQINSEAYIWNERAWIEFTDWPKSTVNISSAPIDAIPMVTIYNSGKSVAKIVRATANEVDDGWKKIGRETVWPVSGRLIKAGSTATLRAFPINLDVGVKKQFIIDVEYRILGGETDCFECRLSMSLTKSDGSIGGFKLEYSK